MKSFKSSRGKIEKKKKETDKHTGLDRKHAQKRSEKAWADVKTHRPAHERSHRSV